MSEDEQELNIVKLFKSELKLIIDALFYKINQSSWDQSADVPTRICSTDLRVKDSEDLLVKLLTDDIVTKIRERKLIK